jgi:glycogen operon protein
VRGFWRGDDGLVSDLAYRLTGSSDLYEGDGRKPYASVNFVTAHDGFTLADLVSYNEKHNEANGEDNQDGHNHNLSWNCGVEGPTDDPLVNELRSRQQRNFIATLMLSQGVPMLQAGDEMGRTQHGNNNAYCQDNKTTWLNWNIEESREQLLEFTRLMTRLFHEHPVLQRRKFFQGRRIRGSEVRDLVWFRADGEEMTEDDWNNPLAHSIALRLAGDAIDEVDDHGAHITDDTLLVMMSAEAGPIEFTLPAHRSDVEWKLIVDTRFPLGRPAGPVALRGGVRYGMEARSLALFKLLREE